MGLNPHIVEFSDLDKTELEKIGEKAYRLGELKHLGIPIPDCFVLTTDFFRQFLKKTGISTKIDEVQKLNHPAIKDSVSKLFISVSQKIIQAPIPQNLSHIIYSAYKKRCGIFNDASFNIFSSSLNGKHLFFSNIKGDANLFLKIKMIWSFFLQHPVAIVIQKHIQAKIKGKIATNDPLLNSQELLTSVQAEQLRNFAKKIQKHFYFPQVISYFLEKGRIYVTDVAPWTGISKFRKVLVKGLSLSPGIATGHVRILKNNNISNIKNSEIIALPRLDLTLLRKIKNARAIIADSVILRNHDAIIIGKFLKIPAIYNAKNSTQILRAGSVVTVNAIKGEVYQGGLL